MHQLESMTFFNSQRFPYAHIDLSGNTIVVGANGIGKTSSLRVPLFFYGVNDRYGLGIRSDNKLSFGAYFLQDINSYIFFTYTNAFGRVLLMVYRPSDKIRYRFAMLDEEKKLKEIVLDDAGNAYAHDDIIAVLQKHGINMSDPVMSTEYREILYGTDKADSRYKRFALFKGTKDFAQLPATLSSIFINSTVKSSSVQGALSGCIEGAISLGLSQFRRQIDKAMDKYYRIQGFEAKSIEIKKVTLSLNGYGTAFNEAIKTTRQLLANAVLFLEQKNKADARLGQIKTEIDERELLFSSINSEFDEKIDALGKHINMIEFQINTAEKKQAQHTEAGIERMLYDFERLNQYRITLQQANSRYEQLVGGNLDIANGFDQQIKDEHSALKQILFAIQGRRNTLDSDYNSAFTKADEERDDALATIKRNRVLGREEIRKEVDGAATLKQQASDAKIAALHADPKKEERESLKEAVSAHRLNMRGAQAKVGEAQRRGKQLEQDIDSVSEQRQQLIQRQEKMLVAQLITVSKEIKEQEARLDISENTLLGQIRNHNHANEPEVAALLKDDILLSDSFSPSFDTNANSTTIYGISIDTSKLDLSRYDLSVIKERLNALMAKKVQITKGAQEETDRLVEEVDKKIQLKRKEFRQCTETIAEEEPKAKEHEIKMLQAQSLLDELVESSEKMRKEAMEATENMLVKARTNHNAALKKIEDYDFETERLGDEIRTRYKKAKLAEKAIKEEKERFIAKERTEAEDTSKEREGRLHKQKLKALEEGGVSAIELAEAEREKNEAVKEFERVNGYHGKIEVYKNDKMEYIDKIPSFKNNLVAMNENYGTLRAEKIKREEKHKDSLKLLHEEALMFGKKLGMLTGECEKYEKFKQENLFEKYGSVAAHSALTPATEDAPTDLIARLRQCDMEIHRHTSNMRIGLNEVFGIIGEDNNLFGFERPGDSTSSLISAAKRLSDFIDDGRLGEVKKLVAQQFLMTHRTITEASSAFLRNSDDVRAMVTKMNSSLRNLSGIRVIESVQVRYAKSENPTLSLLEKMQDMDIGAGFEATLFDPTPDIPAATTKLLEILENISNMIEKEKSDSLNLSDSFSLEFRVVENGRDSNWLSSLDDIGSNGTDVLVKTMIYVAMLDMVMTSAQRNKSETRIHVLLDEVGVLAQSYLRELIEFANARNILFFNGAPDPKIPGKYNATYTIRRESASTSSVLPTARKL